MKNSLYLIALILVINLSLTVALKNKVSARDKLYQKKSNLKGTSKIQVFKPEKIVFTNKYCFTNNIRSECDELQANKKIGDYELEKLVDLDEENHYQKWWANKDDDSYFIKVYTQSPTEMLRYANGDGLAGLECKQLLMVQDNVANRGIKNVKFPKCLNTIPRSNPKMPVYNTFAIPDGKYISNTCIFNKGGDCREYLSDIARKLLVSLMAVEDLELGIGKIDVDHIYYETETNILSFNEMIVLPKKAKNIVEPQNDHDLSDIGNLLAQILTKHCKLTLNGLVDDSAIKLYLKVQEINKYAYTDDDLGVPANLDLRNDNDGIDVEEKENMMKGSIYDFIVRCIEGPNQFESAEAALSHPFITTPYKKPSKNIENISE